MTVKQYATILYTLLEQEKDEKKAIDSFVSYVASRHELSKMTRILTAFERIYDEKQDIKRVHVSSKYPLTTEMKKALTDNLQSQFPGKRVELKEQQQEALIGGIKLRFDDKVIDYSVKGTLRHLRTHLKETLSLNAR